MILRLVVILLIDFCVSSLCLGQRPLPAQWRYDYTVVSDDAVILQFQVKLAPGWHIYSQHLDAGGPLPTRFSFQDAEHFQVIGTPEEQGEPNTYYDSIYEMNVTWYAEAVLFTQRLRLISAGPVAGQIAYMVCNADTCVPREQAFCVFVDRKKR